MTNEQQNSPAPYNAPILQLIPPGPVEDTIAVITSPAPFAKAIRVTADIAGESPKISDILVIDGATYLSMVQEINLKIR